MNPEHVLSQLTPVHVQAELYRRSFRDYVAWAWPLMTGAPFVANGATDKVIASLQAIADGVITRLLVAIPPGCGKTTLLALYSSWRLARDPSWRSIHASHAADLARTESRRVRRLVEGDEYRRLFPGMELRPDESTAEHWATTRDGRYFAVGTDGALTGRRAHEAVCDDPLNAIDRFSKAARDSLWAWFTESLSTRLDGDRAPMVVVQQRLDRDDLIGRLIDAGGWTLVELPAELEDGSLLAENVLPREKLETLKRQIGSAAYACQFLQRPQDDSTALIKRSWWRYYKPGELPEKFDRVVIACDLTFGSQQGDYAVVQAWAGNGGSRYLLEQWRARAGFEESLVAIQTLARRYPRAKIIVEKAANGAAVIETLQKRIPNVVPKTPLGSKAQRLSAIAPTVESGSCYLPSGATWVGEFVEELSGATRHDDMADAAAYAIHELDAAGQDVERARKLCSPAFIGGLVALGSGQMPQPARPLSDEEAIAQAKATDMFEAVRRRGRF